MVHDGMFNADQVSNSLSRRRASRVQLLAPMLFGWIKEAQILLQRSVSSVSLVQCPCLECLLSCCCSTLFCLVSTHQNQ